MMNNAPRYNSFPFPPYRFVPGQTPHPVIHPEGHSYGKKEEKPQRLPPSDWKKNEAYLYGIDLFNHGFWWEAHEAWENIWLTTPKHDLEGQFLQALIQFSASLLKIYSGQWTAFEKLLQESKRRFHFCLAELTLSQNEIFMGLDLKAWLQRQQYFIETLSLFKAQKLDVLELREFPHIFLEPSIETQPTP